MVFRWTGYTPARHWVRVALLLALLACWFAGTPSWAAATIERVDVGHAHITIHFDRNVAAASSFVLDDPQRIAVDLEDARPGGSVQLSGPVTNVRQSARGDGARIVFDLARPAVVTEGRYSVGDNSLTLAIRTVDDAAFARAAADEKLQFLPPFSWASAAAPRPAYSVSMPVPAARTRLQLPTVYGDDASRPLVVIDAGHGGHDPGAIGNSGKLREKDVTLKIAKAIRDALLASGRVRVALTREDDRFLVLQERYGVARKLHADLFISIHCDSVGEGNATGASVYTLSEVASDKESARLAARENKADIIAGVDLADANPDISSILIDLTQRETMNNSANFAKLLGREAQGQVPFKANYHRMASLMVLKAPDMPSILFETGYISNRKDAEFLASEEGRERIAQSVSRAVGIHFARRMAAR
jgi:N-acetylmuramoyl-L-alanine amidase